MKRIELIIYDFDGTLVDTLDDIALSLNLALKELGVRQLEREAVKTCVGRGVAMLMTQALNGTGCDDIEKAVSLFREYYARHLMDHTRFYPNCREIIEFFSDKKQAICSNKPEDFVRKILFHLECENHFEFIIGGDSFPTPKPHPQGILHILSQLNLSPDEALMVGDSALDIETGKNAGVNTCAVTYGLSDEITLNAAGPDWTIDDISGLKNLLC